MVDPDRDLIGTGKIEDFLAELLTGVGETEFVRQQAPSLNDEIDPTETLIAGDGGLAQLIRQLIDEFGTNGDGRGIEDETLAADGRGGELFRGEVPGSIDFDERATDGVGEIGAEGDGRTGDVPECRSELCGPAV